MLFKSKVYVISEPFDCYVDGKLFKEKKPSTLEKMNLIAVNIGHKLKNFSDESGEKLKKMLLPRKKVDLESYTLPPIQTRLSEVEIEMRQKYVFCYAAEDFTPGKRINGLNAHYYLKLTKGERLWFIRFAENSTEWTVCLREDDGIQGYVHLSDITMTL